jgi:hypothetical protein
MILVKSIILIISVIFQSCICSYAIDIKDFYRIFASGTLVEVNTCLQQLKSEKPISQINAFTGAMLMKRANLEKAPKVKLESFKSGYQLLEAEISENPNNIEYHFLRIAIQENAPKYLGYNKNLLEDKGAIIQGFKKLNIFLQNYIIQYCNQSKILSVKDLQ